MSPNDGLLSNPRLVVYLSGNILLDFEGWLKNSKVNQTLMRISDSPLREPAFRSMLNWSQQHLVSCPTLDPKTIQRFQKSDSVTYSLTCSYQQLWEGTRRWIFWAQSSLSIWNMNVTIISFWISISCLVVSNFFSRSIRCCNSWYASRCFVSSFWKNSKETPS